MLKQRVITASVLALLTLWIIVALPSLYVSWLLAAVSLLSVLELLNLTIRTKSVLSWLIALLFSAIFLWSLSYAGQQLVYYQSLATLFMWVVILLYLFTYRYSGNWSYGLRFCCTLLSLLLLWSSIHALFFIHHHFAQGGWIMMYVLTLVWVADVGAYFSGKRFGKHKLAISISPGKTLEGVIGGLLLNVLWITFVYWLSGGWDISYAMFLLLGLVTSALSVVGDLYESILKREAGMKDSGKLLPGHGGMMDRIDSLIAAAPVYLAGLFLLQGV